MILDLPDIFSFYVYSIPVQKYYALSKMISDSSDEVPWLSQTGRTAKVMIIEQIIDIARQCDAVLDGIIYSRIHYITGRVVSFVLDVAINPVSESAA